jgi:ABC-type multidrug transport system permease subunit
MKSGNIYRFIIGALMLISGVVFITLSPGEPVIGSFLIFSGCAFFITGIIRQRRYGDGPETDERSRRIGAYGLSYAWLTGIFFMFMLFWADYLGVLKLNAQVALALSIIVLALSALIYQIYLFRKGDAG